ncbi:protein-L-isoaspartate(D-aspartate) O-methyltransferase [Marinigracilibium pacificum]|uniref:Protein-L-isoaspartate O-methyltransferase n=1 Tax=Marinigracilibium pacificum TaxID=2729599 RepID=A0A848J850_9BACT|nr:protein-L-isoaspartate(D-aspartate) O-methyltransferase [Marinigracilibium pacificum]
MFAAVFEDNYRTKGLRRNLVKTIESKGIKDINVLNAINKIPRHYFFDQALLEHAYQDKAFPIGEGQTISQPYTVAFQSELLEVEPGQKILEIGTGSGYQACVLLELGAKVITIEYQKKLYDQTRKVLPKMGYNATFLYGDGSQGVPRHAPFDRIIVTAGAPIIPKPLVEQLNIGGILVIPVGDDKKQKMVKIKKIDTNKIAKKEYDLFSFVPLKGKHGWGN